MGNNIFTINIANPVNLLLFLFATVLLIFLGQELKKSLIPQIILIVYVIMLVLHMLQISSLNPATDAEVITTLYKCITYDLLFVLVTFLSYLWVDDMEAKLKNKKSLDNSLDWFWNTKV